MTDARCSRRWAPGALVIHGGLDNGSQVGIRWCGDVSLSGGNEKVTWSVSTYPDVYPGIDTGLESSKSSVPRLVRTRIVFPHAPTFIMLIL